MLSISSERTAESVFLSCVTLVELCSEAQLRAALVHVPPAHSHHELKWWSCFSCCSWNEIIRKIFGIPSHIWDVKHAGKLECYKDCASVFNLADKRTPRDQTKHARWARGKVWLTNASWSNNRRSYCVITWKMALFFKSELIRYISKRNNSAFQSPNVIRLPADSQKFWGLSKVFSQI